MEPEKMRQMAEENNTLESKLAMLVDRKKHAVKVTRSGGKIMPFQENSFHTKSNEFSMTQSALNYDMLSVYHQRRAERLEGTKRELELEGCTFKPTLSKLTEDIYKDKDVSPIYERNQRKDKPAYVDPDEVQFEKMKELFVKKYGRKGDPEFYNKKVEWERVKKNKRNQKKLENAIDIYSTGPRIPKVNTKVNKKLVKDTSPFLNRVEAQKSKVQEKKKKIEQKMYNYPYKPKLNDKKQAPMIYTSRRSQLGTA